MKKYLYLLCVSLLMPLCVSAQTQVAVYGSDKSQVEGIAYRLPRNRIAVRIAAVKSTYTPGRFVRYAEEYLKVAAPVAEETITWELTGMESECLAVPDPQKAYFIKVTERTSAPNVQLTDDGLLLAVNTESAVSARTVLPTGAMSAQTVLPMAGAKDPAAYYTTEIVQASSPATTARLIAEEIYLLREKRNDLLRGELDNMPKDGASMQLILDQYKAQEEALASVFLGTTTTEGYTETLYIEPDGEAKEQVLFRFSQQRGVLGADETAGAPIYFSLVSGHTVPERSPVSEADRKRAEKLAKENEKRVVKGEPFLTEGIVYNVPERVALTVFTAQKQWIGVEYRIAQMGNTEVLLQDLFDKRTSFHAVLNAQDGSLLRAWQDEQTKR
jgi:hypothetical protein